LVNRRRGFESCVRLHTMGSDVFASVAQTDRVASFYLARCGFKSRRRLVDVATTTAGAAGLGQQRENPGRWPGYSVADDPTHASRMVRLISIVGEGGLEPPRPEGHWHLKPARLPFRHSPQQPGKTITHTGSLPNRADGAGPNLGATPDLP
jgi:hypothetical protein